MTIYWIDSSVLIQSRHKYHTKERVPQFWSWLDGKLDSGVIQMPHRAYREVTAGNDWLVKWCKDRRDRGLDVSSSAEVQSAYRQLVAHVEHKYRHAQHQIREFQRGADGWVIAHAKATRGIAVSEEDRARKNATSSIKIPNLCREIQPRVRWLDTFGMLDELEADFSR